MNENDKLNLLVAYPYCSNQTLEILTRNKDRVRFLLDSGAFTAFTLGKTITLDDYCRFLEKLPIKPWRYFSLDVIRDEEKTVRNYETMLKRGFNPVPVFQRGSDWSLIDEFYKTSEVIGLGGLVGGGNRSKIFVKEAMKHIKGRKVHWLGFTNDEFIKYYKPYMCDSSSWAASAQYGTLALYISHGRMIRVNKSEFLVRPQRMVSSLIRTRGFSTEVLARSGAWVNTTKHDLGRYAMKVTANSYIRKSLDYKKHIGVNLFNAVTDSGQVEMFIDEHKKIIKD